MKRVDKGSMIRLAATALLGLVSLSACSLDSSSPAATPTIIPTPTAVAVSSTAPTVVPTAASAAATAVPTSGQSNRGALPTQAPILQAQAGDVETSQGGATPAIPQGGSTPSAKGTPTKGPGGKMLADNGFRPNPDGYSFENYSSRRLNGKVLGELSLKDVIKMFGPADVCLSLDNGVCIPKEEALSFMEMLNDTVPSGHCEGMSISSLAIFKGLDTPSDYGDGAKTTYDLQLTDQTREYISYYFFTQYLDPIVSYIHDRKKDTPSQVLDEVIASMKNGSPDPVTLEFNPSPREAGHSITATGVEDRGNGIFWIHVYDNNWPNRSDAYMEIDRTNDTWTYDISQRDPSEAPQVWTGDASSETLQAAPLSVRTGTLVCPWCDNAGSGTQGSGSSPAPAGVGSVLTSALLGSANSVTGSVPAQASNNQGVRFMQVMLGGSGHLLIKNSNGQRLGFDGNQLVNEIPGARYMIPATGVPGPVEPVYYLPDGDAYSITVDGQTLTRGATANDSVSVVAKGLTLRAENLTLGAGEQHVLSLSQDARTLSFVPGNSTARPTFSVATTLAGSGPTPTASYLFQVGNMNVTKSQAVTLALNSAAGQLNIKSTRAASTSVYDLSIRRTARGGTQMFKQSKLSLLGGDTHHVNFGAWTTTHQMTVGVDHGSKGTVDSTQTVPTAEPTAQP